MRGTVVKSFPWSPDGIRVEHLSPGEEREFGAFFTGLSDFGFVEEVQALAGAPETGALTGAPESKGGEGQPSPPSEPEDGSEPPARPESEGADGAPGGEGPMEGARQEPEAEGGGQPSIAAPPPAGAAGPVALGAGDVATSAVTAPGESGSSEPAEERASQAAADLEVKHVGRGKYAVYRGEQRLTDEPLTKAEAEAKLAELKG